MVLVVQLAHQIHRRLLGHRYLVVQMAQVDPEDLPGVVQVAQVDPEHLPGAKKEDLPRLAAQRAAGRRRRRSSPAAGVPLLEQVKMKVLLQQVLPQDSSCHGHAADLQPRCLGQGLTQRRSPQPLLPGDICASGVHLLGGRSTLRPLRWTGQESGVAARCRHARRH